MKTNRTTNLRRNTIRVELSEQEEQLASLIAIGLTDAEVAGHLVIARQTVEQRITQLLAKIGAHNRLEILLFVYSEPILYQRLSTGIVDSGYEEVQGANGTNQGDYCAK
jgi:DNA-binding NarL/FixJ family response regulator